MVTERISKAIESINKNHLLRVSEVENNITDFVIKRDRWTNKSLHELMAITDENNLAFIFLDYKSVRVY